MKTLKNLLSIGTANIFGNGIGAVFWLYMATILDSEKYGIVNYFIGIASITGVICLIGAPSVLTVYTAKNIKIQSTFFLISIIGVSVSSIVLTLMFHRLDITLLIFGFVITDLATSVMLGNRSYTDYGKYLFVQKSLLVILAVSLFHLIGLDGIIYGIAFSNFIFLPIIYKESKNSKINFTLLKNNFRFIIGSYVMSLVGSFRGQIDKLLIAPFLGYSLLGNYMLTYQVYAVLMTFSSIIFRYTLPQDSINELNLKLKKFTIFGSIIIAIIGSLALPLIIPTLFPKFSNTIQGIQIMSLSVIPSTINLLYASKLLGNEKNKMVLLGITIQLVSQIVGIVFLGQYYGLVGLAFAFLISASLNTIFLFCTSKLELRGT